MEAVIADRVSKTLSKKIGEPAWDPDSFYIWKSKAWRINEDEDEDDDGYGKELRQLRSSVRSGASIKRGKNGEDDDDDDDDDDVPDDVDHDERARD